MDEAIIAVEEKLVAEFPAASTSTVIRILTDCAAEFPEADPLFVEQAARAGLRHVQ